MKKPKKFIYCTLHYYLEKKRKNAYKFLEFLDFKDYGVGVIVHTL